MLYQEKTHPIDLLSIQIDQYENRQSPIFLLLAKYGNFHQSETACPYLSNSLLQSDNLLS